MGVRGIRIAEEDYVVGLAVATTGATLLIASENGIGKRSPFEDYRKTFRGGKGVKAMNVTEKSGPLIGAVTVTEEDELMLMTSSGQSIRIRVSDIRETGRVTQGVKLLTLKGNEKLQDISIVIPDGDDSDSAPATGDEDTPIIEEAGDETSQE
jgi:DNA gyrase subunit A